uniref:Uncharacterized protein n=1 Tax=Pyramimonas orientalis virus TaxID=455367 RepID=A0A7M3UP45_POV01|nr:hypothetical protein HWQ62_00371 [Pyramimonas orientalis virus]
MNTAKTVEAILNKEDKAVDHIIKQNKLLQNNLDRLKLEITEINNEKSDLEDEVDGITKSKNTLQGYMKNIHEMNKIERKLKRNYSTMYTNFRRLFYTIVINSLMFYMLVMNVHNVLIQFVSYISYATITLSFTYYIFKNEQSTLRENANLIKELAVIVKATDMVNDLLDSL